METVKNSIMIMIIALLVGCVKQTHTDTEYGLTSMDKFFECLGDSSKCKDIMNKEQKETFEKQVSQND